MLEVTIKKSLAERKEPRREREKFGLEWLAWIQLLNLQPRWRGRWSLRRRSVIWGLAP